MKKTLFIFIFLGVTMGLFVNPSVKAFDNSHEKKGRCTGSSSCTACSNCSRCAHCSSGGTCGVCDRSYSKSIDYKPKKRNKRSAKSNYPTHSRTSASKNQNASNSTSVSTNQEILIVKKAVLNVRKEASINAVIIEKVYKNARLIKLKALDSWYQIKVEKTGIIGYVYAKELK